MRDVAAARSYSVGFAELRQRFRNAAQRAGAELTEYVHPLHGPAGEVLATDIAFIGRRSAPKVMVLISGTHGVEGQFGSACQTAWLEENAPWRLPDDTAILAIHLINPWGTAWSRRVNEDNVDLNRNFIDWQAAAPKNEKYADLHAALVCQEWEGPDRVRADEALDAARKRLGGHAGIAPIVEAGQRDPSGRTARSTTFWPHSPRRRVTSWSSTCTPELAPMAIPRCCRSPKASMTAWHGANPCSARRSRWC